ncbi:MAG: peptidoglycan editing factor PgeF [Candidatus Paceibacterota bacterium]|jgi:hypothetical protein
MKEVLSYLWGTSQKSDGQMSVYSDDVSVENRKIFFKKLGLDPGKIVLAGLSHSSNVDLVGEESIGQKINNTDGLITNVPGIILTITSADCLPIFFFDKNKEVIGLAHAGWRGVESNIVSKVIEKMRSKFGSNPKDITVNIGPHIKSCHFEIKDDLVEKFSQYKDFITTSDGVTNLDLSAIVREQLKDCGVNPDSINISSECTYCLPDKYYSFRRDKPEKVEVMVSYSVMGN